MKDRYKRAHGKLTEMFHGLSCHVQLNIIAKIKEKQLVWYGHMRRMGEDYKEGIQMESPWQKEEYKVLQDRGKSTESMEE
jgi:hypothetical protein